MNPNKKAEELIEKFKYCQRGFVNPVAKQCALICVERNIEDYENLLQRMDMFSNESREVIHQLIENEQQVKQLIINKK